MVRFVFNFFLGILLPHLPQVNGLSGSTAALSEESHWIGSTPGIHRLPGASLGSSSRPVMQVALSPSGTMLHMARDTSTQKEMVSSSMVRDARNATVQEVTNSTMQTNSIGSYKGRSYAFICMGVLMSYCSCALIWLGYHRHSNFEWAVKCLLVLSCMISGALTTVTLKALFQTTVMLTDGSVTTFHCSFFAGFLQFLAMFMLVVLQALVKYGSSRNPSHETLSSSAASLQTPAPEAFSSCDIISYVFGRWNLGLSVSNVVITFFTQTALVFVPATVHAALRQSNIPMIVAVRMYMFKQRCTQCQLIGVCILTCGLVLMAVASHTGNDHSQNAMHYVVGIAFLCVASALLTVRYVSEEVLMQRDRIPPMVVVGAQGFMGSIVSAILLVVAHHIGLENFWHTVSMFRASAQVQALVAQFVALTIVYNFTTAYTTQMFDATCKAMVRGTKAIWVWSLQFLCFYILDSKFGMQHYGEPWVPRTSWCALFAAIVVSSGMCLYFHKGNKPSCKQMDEGKLKPASLIENQC